MNPEQVEKFLDDGWLIVDVPQPDIIHETAQALEKKAQQLCGADCRLSQLHSCVDEDAFRGFHLAMAKCFCQIEFRRHFSHTLMGSLKHLIGPDILVQYLPYLRLARPGKPQDNTGYHKDRPRSQAPYEMAVHVPFVDVDEGAALRVISGSHRRSEETYPFMQGAEYDAAKGPGDHLLGKPYASRRLSVPQGVQTVPLAMHVGQAALFSPALFHGQEVNRGRTTRVTTDLLFLFSKPNAFFAAGTE